MNNREQVVEAYERLGGNVSAAARELGLARSTVYHHLAAAGIQIDKPIAEGRINERDIDKMPLPKKGQIARYILTSAQNNTKVNAKVWESLVVLANHYEALIFVGTFTYNMNRYGQLSVKRGTQKEKQSELWYDPNVVVHLYDNRVELAPGLHWCGEMNILPTAIDPLCGFETYTGTASGIFPHAKFAMRSVPSGSKYESAKMNYTTGCVTQRNYVAKKSGLRAEHHHGYGGLVVEVDHYGNWWVRQLNATDDGEIHDLTIMVKDGKVVENERVEAISWGDVHVARLDPLVNAAAWDEGGMLDALKPKYQFIHDIMLGIVTNHWESQNPHERFRRYCKGGQWSSLSAEIRGAADFLKRIKRNWCETIVVDSNHDRPWIERWLRETDGRNDPRNVVLWLKLQLALYEEIQKCPDHRDFNILAYALKMEGLPDKHAEFLKRDASFPITKAKIECGMHGHLGPNGARGNASNLRRLGRKANIGHTHDAGIWDGLYVAGISCTKDLGYNEGPSSWSHSHIVTYTNGKRAIVTMRDNRWRA